MASIIPGYNYDIFISYREKDNKHDGWVTVFVNNLKGIKPEDINRKVQCPKVIFIF